MGIEILKNKKLKDLKGIYLFGSNVSNNFVRAAFLLEEKNLKWEKVSVNLLKYENFEPEYLKINPQGSIPAMIHDGLAIYGSENILKYLEEVFPDPSCTPVTNEEKSEMWEWVSSATRTHIETAIGILYKNKMGRPIRKDKIEDYKKYNPNKLKFMQERGYHMTKAQEEEVMNINHAKLSMLDDRLKQGKYIMGDQVSVADFAWVPDIEFLISSGFDVSSYQNILKWKEVMKQRPSWNDRSKLSGKGLKVFGLVLRMMSRSNKYMD